MFACPVRHEATLQHYRPPSVTRTVTRLVLTQSRPNGHKVPCQRTSNVCLNLRNGARIFRGGVQVGRSATYFSRPTPTLAFVPTRPGAKVPVGALPSGQWHHECA